MKRVNLAKKTEIDMELSRVAYEAYSDSAAGKSLVTKDPLPPYDELPDEIKAAWKAGADAVREACQQEVQTGSPQVEIPAEGPSQVA